MKKFLFFAAIFAVSLSTYAQVGIGTTTPAGVLDVVAADSGVIVPRVANAAAVTVPVNGMIIYDMSLNCFNFYENGAWSGCKGAGGASTPTSASVLAQIGNEGDSPDTVNSVVTVAELGVIAPAVTGLDAANETAYQDYIDANPGSFSSPATQAEVQAMVNAVNAATSGGATYCTGGPTAVVDVVGAGGATWMDRNLGATRVATSTTDAAAYGDLYQWGRFTDGHQCRTSGTTSTNSATDTPGHGDFITEGSSPYDWRSTQNDALWQGVSGVNNPCPSGYRLPTETELNTERLAWGSNNAAGALNSPLKLPLAGGRNSSNGTLVDVGTGGGYWSSTVSGTSARYLYFSSSNASMNASTRANGLSVRCLKD